MSTFARLLKYVWTADLLVTVVANQFQIQTESVRNNMSNVDSHRNKTNIVDETDFPKDLCFTFPTKVTMVKTVFGILRKFWHTIRSVKSLTGVI